MEFHRKNCRAGYANFLKRGGDLFIGDIHLEPEHRGKELGKNAIAYIRGFATQRGFNRLTGKVKHSDYKERPWLPDYYRKHGFTVTDCNDGSAVVEICMELT